MDDLALAEDEPEASSEYASEEDSDDEDEEEDDDDDDDGELAFEDDGPVDAFWDDPPPPPCSKIEHVALTFEDLVEAGERETAARREQKVKETEAFVAAEHERIVAARARIAQQREAEHAGQEQKPTVEPPRPRPSSSPLWHPTADPAAPKKKPLDVAQLPDLLKRVLRLWESRHDAADRAFQEDPTWSKAQMEQAYSEYLAYGPCPWAEFWSKDKSAPRAFLVVEDVFIDEVKKWLTAADALKVDAGPHAVTSEDDQPSGLRQVLELGRTVRTLVHLCDALTNAQARVNDALRRKGDDVRRYKAEMLVDGRYRSFQAVRSYLYQQTEHYKTHKKQYDKARNADPKLKAERKKRRADPEFMERERLRKREARATAKEKKAKNAADAKVMEDVIEKV